MIDGVPRLQSAIPDEAAADKFVASTRKQAESLDANDLLHTIESSLWADHSQPSRDCSAMKTPRSNQTTDAAGWRTRPKV
jgi:hypothetical protein